MRNRKAFVVAASLISFVAGGAVATLVLVEVLGYRPSGAALKPVAVASTGTSPSSNKSPSPVASPVIAPSSRLYASMAFDEARGNVVLFGGGGIGGSSDSKGFSDTWTWDGSAWQQRHPSTEPPARTGAGMTYFPEKKVVLMWGGLEDGMRLGADFWSWDGTDWTPIRSSGDAPPADNEFYSYPGPILTYDSVRHLVVLMRNNGFHPAGPREPDFWTWDGTNWSHPSASGAQWVWGSGAYDPALKTTVFFGVDGQSNPQTWTIDGNKWTKLPSTLAPTFGLDQVPPMVFYKPANTVALVDTSGAVWLWADGDWTKQKGSEQMGSGAGFSLTFDTARGVVVRFDSGQMSTWNGQTWK